MNSTSSASEASEVCVEGGGEVELVVGDASHDIELGDVSAEDEAEAADDGVGTDEGGQLDEDVLLELVNEETTCSSAGNEEDEDEDDDDKPVKKGKGKDKKSKDKGKKSKDKKSSKGKKKGKK
jgi:hypothetical protein